MAKSSTMTSPANAGKLRGVADDAAVSNLTVVTDVHILHEQIAVAYYRLSFRSRAAADGDILADGVVVTNFAGSIFALELQILRFGRDAGTREYLVVVAETRAEVQRHAVQQFVVVANYHVFVNDAEGTDDVVVTKLCLGVNHC